jgi:hypothetical protein
MHSFTLASIIKSVLWISAVTISFFVVSKTSRFRAALGNCRS